MNVIKNNDGTVSKVKIGAWLVAGAAILGTLASIVNGQATLIGSVQTLATEVGALFAALGIRDIPILNSITGKA